MGFGCIYNDQWIYGDWPTNFIRGCQPSIENLELYGLVVGLLTWQTHQSNMRINIFCDNQAVVHMVNNISSSCEQYMKLIRMMVLNRL